MPRICPRCNRPLDAEHHTILRHEKGPRKGQPIRRPMIVRRGRGRLGIQKVLTYECKVRLIAQSPSTGKVGVPPSPQRIKELDTRYVHEDRLKPGGDLNP